MVVEAVLVMVGGSCGADGCELALKHVGVLREGSGGGIGQVAESGRRWGGPKHDKVGWAA